MFHVMLVLPALIAAYAALNVVFSVVAWLVLWSAFFLRRIEQENLRKRTVFLLSMPVAVGFATVLENFLLFAYMFIFILFDN